MGKYLKGWLVGLVACVSALAADPPPAVFLAYDAGTVTWTPSVVATPVIGAIVAMITAAVAFIVIRAGWRWAKSLLRG